MAAPVDVSVMVDMDVGRRRTCGSGGGGECGGRCWGDTKGLAGVTKGMARGGRGVVEVPAAAVVHETGMIRALVAGAGAGALVEGDGGLLLLDGGDEPARLVVADGRVDGRHGALATRAALGDGGHGGVEAGELLHHVLVLLLLVRVDRLRMLAEVVEARELLAAVAAEGAFARVFPSVAVVSERPPRG
jgi:hypothetical protein